MKTKEELNALKEEVETVSRKLRELTEEELEQVSGGLNGLPACNNDETVLVESDSTGSRYTYINETHLPK